MILVLPSRQLVPGRYYSSPRRKSHTLPQDWCTGKSPPLELANGVYSLHFVGYSKRRAGSHQTNHVGVDSPRNCPGPNSSAIQMLVMSRSSPEIGSREATATTLRFRLVRRLFLIPRNWESRAALIPRIAASRIAATLPFPWRFAVSGRCLSAAL
eukprot:scaffold3719_cov247-Pinguiococcus_pyrenoidosus.AAC.18